MLYGSYIASHANIKMGASCRMEYMSSEDTDEQVKGLALIILLSKIVQEYKVSLDNEISNHECIITDRKDPSSKIKATTPKNCKWMFKHR